MNLGVWKANLPPDFVKNVKFFQKLDLFLLVCERIFVQNISHNHTILHYFLSLNPTNLIKHWRI